MTGSLKVSVAKDITDSDKYTKNREIYSDNYIVELSKENVIDAEINEYNQIVISPFVNGDNDSVTLTLYKKAEDGTKTKIGSPITIKVQDNAPKISTIQMNDIEKIVKFKDDKNDSCEFRVENLFNIKKAYVNSDENVYESVDEDEKYN